jgi:hypothetical protein
VLSDESTLDTTYSTQGNVVEKMLLKLAHPSLVTLILVLFVLLKVVIPNEAYAHDLLICVLVAEDDGKVGLELLLDLASNFGDGNILIQKLLAVKNDT